MENFEIMIEKYAELTVKVGVNIQKGQTLVINAPIIAKDFIRMVTKKAYEVGAKNVYVDWSDEEITLIKFMNAPEEAFKEFPLWKAKGYEDMAKEGAAFLSISASNPDLLKDVNPQHIATANKTAAMAMEEYRKYPQTGKVSWAVVSVPTKEWAAKIFPELSEEESIEKLWKNIFNVTRVTTENPVKAWDEHIDNLKNKMDYLNNKKFKKLYYKAPGTNLTVELPLNHIWIGGGLTNEKGIYFMPNMPTEEVFTMPLKEGVNGVLSSTKPLNYSGTVIDNFKLTFENGKIIDFTAEKGYETLKKLIETDGGSHYLGEVALVPHHSPVSDCNIIFYNTLFDENASCHFAIGAAYPICIQGGTTMNKEELEKHGANTSFTHVDFMVGSTEMNIDGETADGKVEAIFRNGN
jgi:aminopeptidase